jgi:uncharacterized protein YukE
MTTPDQFRTAPDQLEGHAGSLAAVADELAAVAGRMPDSIGEQSLGSFAQFIVAGLQGAMAETLAAVNRAASTTDQMSTGMRQTAADYRREDDDRATTFSQEIAL